MRTGLVMSEYPSPHGHGGMATYTYNLANALARQGHAVTIAQKAGVKTDPLEPSVRVETLEPYAEPGLTGRYYRRRFPAMALERAYSYAAKKLFEARPLDIVQIPEYNGEAIAFSRVPFPLVVRLHTPTYLVDWLNGRPRTRERRAWYRMEQKAIQNARGVTASSHALKTEVCGYYNLRPEKVTVIRNPVDPRMFAPGTTAVPRNGLTLLYTGRLEKRKGIDLVVDITAELLRRHAGVRLVFAGQAADAAGDRYRERLEAAAAGRRASLVFLGEQPRPALADIYRSADIFLMPSLFDNSPNALFEAMASGLPAVGSRTGGIDEIIDDGRTGFLFSIEKPGELLEKIEALINRPALRAEMGEAARLKILSEYAPDRIARQTAAYYETLLRKP